MITKSILKNHMNTQTFKQNIKKGLLIENVGKT
jgi:hypothetical protein